VLNFIQTFRHI